jgi:hypothetical protein
MGVSNKDLLLFLKREMDDPKIYQIALKQEKGLKLSQPEARSLDDFFMKTMSTPEFTEKMLKLIHKGGSGGRTKKKRKVTKKKRSGKAKKRKVTKHKK